MHSSFTCGDLNHFVLVAPVIPLLNRRTQKEHPSAAIFRSEEVCAWASTAGQWSLTQETFMQVLYSNPRILTVFLLPTKSGSPLRIQEGRIHSGIRQHYRIKDRRQDRIEGWSCDLAVPTSQRWNTWYVRALNGNMDGGMDRPLFGEARPRVRATGISFPDSHLNSVEFETLYGGNCFGPLWIKRLPEPGYRFIENKLPFFNTVCYTYIPHEKILFSFTEV